MSLFLGLFSGPSTTVPADRFEDLPRYEQSVVEWIEIHLDDEILYFSKVAYNDRGGPFVPRLLTLGSVRRALSDELTGSSDRPSYTFTLMDGALSGAHSRARVLRASYDTTQWKGREAVAKMATLATLRAGGTPITVYRCYMQAFSWIDLTLTVQGVDFLSAQGTVAEPEFLVPNVRISRSVWTTLPANHPALGLTAPFLFGVHDDDSPGFGPIPIIPLEWEELPNAGGFYRVGLLAYHACPPITGLWFGSDRIDLGGTNVLVPGYAGYQSIFGASAPLYLDKNGQRVTRVLVNPFLRWMDDWVAGSVMLTATCTGVEDSPTGNGTGSPIVNLLDQERWAWKNLRLGQIRTTPLQMPEFVSDGRAYVNRNSYDAALSAQIADIGSPLTGAFLLGGKAGTMTWDAFLAMMRRASLTRSYINHDGQYAIKYYVADEITEEMLGIGTTPYSFADGPVTLEPQDAQHYSVFHANFGKLYVSDGWYRENAEVRALQAADAHGRREDGPVYNLEPIRSWNDARVIGMHLLARHSTVRPLMHLRAPASLPVARLNPGAILSTTHPMGAGANGWESRETDLLSLDLDADAKTVQIMLEDHESSPHWNTVQLTYGIVTLTRAADEHNPIVTVTTVDDITTRILEGDIVTIMGVFPAAFNGPWAVVPIGSHSFTFTVPNNPGANGSGTMTWSSYSEGDRRTKPQKVDVVDPPTGTGPVVEDSIIELGGSSESVNALTPAADTYVPMYEGKPKRIKKASYGRRKVIVEAYLRTNSGGTNLRAAVYLVDGTFIAQSDFLLGPTEFRTATIVLQDFSDDDAVIDRLVDGDEEDDLYEVRVKRNNTGGHIRAYAVAKAL